MSDETPQPVKMVVHEGATPRHIQIHVGPTQAGVDYVDDDGNILYTVVHDRGTIDAIAERKGLEVERVAEGKPEPDLTAAAIARTHAEATGEPIPPEGEVEVEPEPEVTVEQLKAEAKELEIKGRSKMGKDELIAAIAKAKAE